MIHLHLVRDWSNELLLGIWCRGKVRVRWDGILVHHHHQKDGLKRRRPLEINDKLHTLVISHLPVDVRALAADMREVEDDPIPAAIPPFRRIVPVFSLFVFLVLFLFITVFTPSPLLLSLPSPLRHAQAASRHVLDGIHSVQHFLTFCFQLLDICTCLRMLLEQF